MCTHLLSFRLKHRVFLVFVRCFFLFFSSNTPVFCASPDQSCRSDQSFATPGSASCFVRVNLCLCKYIYIYILIHIIYTSYTVLYQIIQFGGSIILSHGRVDPLMISALFESLSSQKGGGLKSDDFGSILNPWPPVSKWTKNCLAILADCVKKSVVLPIS